MFASLLPGSSSHCEIGVNTLYDGTTLGRACAHVHVHRQEAELTITAITGDSIME